MGKSIALLLSVLLSGNVTHGAMRGPAENPALQPDEFFNCSVRYATYLYVLQSSGSNDPEKLNVLDELALMSGGVAQSLDPVDFDARFRKQLMAEMNEARLAIMANGFGPYVDATRADMSACDNLLQNHFKELSNIPGRRKGPG